MTLLYHVFGTVS